MKKRILAFVLNYTGLVKLFLLLRRIVPKNSVLVICYHRVLDIDLRKFELMHGVVDASVADFKKQIKFIARNFNVINLSELMSIYKSGNSPRNTVIITFDDGYKDNYINAYPILKKYGLPATIFLTAGYIGKNQLLWWDKLAYMIKKTSKKEVSINSNGCVHKYDLSTYEKRLQSIRKINSIIKKIEDEKKEDILRSLDESLQVAVDKSVTKNLFLSWHDIKEMSKNEIEFGAHSVTHPILTNLSSAKVEKEILASKERIEQEISKPIKAFAYPGGPYNEECINIVKKAGFECACTYTGFCGINDRKTNPYELERMDINMTTNMHLFKAQLVFPKLMGYGSNKKKRIKSLS